MCLPNESICNMVLALVPGFQQRSVEGLCNKPIFISNL